ncbi:MAG TPA: DUF2007 domain-containing protein [Rectinemataceae bacterium]|nr:DUF2007 domain-containing protein [Rectinemataceae bacterium]
MADVFRTMFQDEALVVTSLLESAGLHAQIAGQHILDVYPIFFPEAGGMRVVVPEEEAEDANSIVADFLANRAAHRDDDREPPEA